jgi:oxygen-independent coproporphyrinogen-3 oxidase
VQDFDPNVQFLINRLQTFERTKEVIDEARAIGFSSVNIDLIYGLPGQSVFSIEHTIDRVRDLNPDRIAYYSYAHVPWKSKGQRRYGDEDVPKAAKKIEMYQRGSERLNALGFENIGMDHFAKPSDKLMQAYSNGMLHRNFMGYTTTNHSLVIGLGASSISDAWNAFAQNEKTVEEYQLKIIQGHWPIVNGHALNETDLIIRRSILDLMCKDVTAIPFYSLSEEHQKEAYEKLLQFALEGLIEMEGHEVRVTEKGRLFIRNIAATLDVYLHSQLGESRFSKAI